MNNDWNIDTHNYIINLQILNSFTKIVKTNFRKNLYSNL